MERFTLSKETTIAETFFAIWKNMILEIKMEQKKFYFYDVGAIVKFNHHQYYLTHYPMLLGPNDTIRNLHGHIHHYSVPIGNDVNVGVDAPERELLKVKRPFGTPLSEKEIEEIYEEKQKELANLQ